jgi:hypothetical protein
MPVEGEEFMVGVIRIGGVWCTRDADGSLHQHDSWISAAMAAIHGPEVAIQDALYVVEGEVAHA